MARSPNGWQWLSARTRVLAVLAVLLAVPACVGGEPPASKEENSNALLKEYRDKVQVTASSAWGGWEAAKAIDGDPETSWFSAQGDAAAKGAKPWIQIKFPQGEAVKRVTILGNREPQWPTGYSVLKAKLELLDKDKKELWSEEREAAGKTSDFDFRPKAAVKGVRFVRFTSLSDQGDQNPYDDIAIAEIQIE